jgi:hypothetical protein
VLRLRPEFISKVSATPEYWLWHKLRDVTQEYACGADAASVIMCGVR